MLKNQDPVSDHSGDVSLLQESRSLGSADKRLLSYTRLAGRLICGALLLLPHHPFCSFPPHHLHLFPQDV